MYKHIAAGRFRMALKDRRAALDRQRIPCESDDACRLLSAFGRYPDLEPGAVRVTTVTGERRRGHLFLPVTIGGISAHYILDTGAAYSVITESEAARLALPVTQVNAGTIGDGSGKGLPITKVAYAKTLKLGGIEFKNVQFLVASDALSPMVWNELPAGWRGVLGIQVLRACETLHWDAAGVVQLGRRSRPDGAASKLRLRGTSITTEARFANRQLDLVLDTGATWSCLFTPFADSFPGLVKQFGKPGTTRSGGAGGDTELQTRVLPEVAMLLGGFRVSLREVHIIPRERHHYGNIGLDVLSQAPEITIDLHSMKLTLR